MTSLVYNGHMLVLPDDLYWSDETTWSPVVQAVERTITGALVVQTHARTAGRPITLESDENTAWITRATLDTLMAWAGVPGGTMQLTYRGVTYACAWRHQDEPVIQATPVVHYADVQATDYYAVVLRFMEV